MSVNQPKSEWRMQSSTGVKVKLLSRKGSFSRGGAEGEEVYVIKAEDLMDFIHTGLPTPYIYAGVTYPGRAVMYGVPSLVVDSISFEGLTDGIPIDPFGFDSDAPDGTYEDDIKCVVKYKPREKGKDNEDSDPSNPFSFLQVSSSSAGEFIASPIPGKARWSKLVYHSWEPDAGTWEEIDQGEVEEANIPGTLKVSMTEWSVSWPQIPYDYFYNTVLPRLRYANGTVNSSTVGLFNRPPPATLLLNGWSTKEEYIWDLGNVTTPPISLEMRFLEKNFFSPDRAYPAPGIQVTHQHVYRPGKGWQIIKIDNHYLYSGTDHNQIWSP